MIFTDDREGLDSGPVRQRALHHRSLLQGQPTVWLRSETPLPARVNIPLIEIADALGRLDRFRPVLSALFPQDDWDGRIRSPLLDYGAPPEGPATLLVKADHALPLTGTIKARGGVYELLCFIEEIGLREGLVAVGGVYEPLRGAKARTTLANYVVGVASTGNLGLSVGLVARRFGLAAEVHMSRDAKSWKRDRLRELGVDVVEHSGDYAAAVAAARQAFAGRRCSHFIDDENSRTLLIGYALGAWELAAQLEARGIAVSERRPLIVYLPCGVGGAPGGVTLGLKAIYGDAVACVFAEPIASASMFAAMAFGGGRPLPVYELGLDNRTLADGLATPAASALVLDVVSQDIDAVVAVPDAALIDQVGRAWRDKGLRLEPSAAAGFAAIGPLRDALKSGKGGEGPLQLWDDATHVVWTTGGSMLRDEDFASLLRGDL